MRVFTIDNYIGKNKNTGFLDCNFLFLPVLWQFTHSLSKILYQKEGRIRREINPSTMIFGCVSWLMIICCLTVESRTFRDPFYREVTTMQRRAGGFIFQNRSHDPLVKLAVKLMTPHGVKFFVEILKGQKILQYFICCEELNFNRTIRIPEHFLKPNATGGTQTSWNHFPEIFEEKNQHRGVMTLRRDAIFFS